MAPSQSTPHIVAGACPYEMHEEQLGWETVKQQWDALSEKEQDRSVVQGVVAD